MPLLPLCRGALATASGSFSVAVALPVATVFAERVFSSRTTQTSYSSLNQGSGTPGHPSQQALSAAHRARKAWSRMYASTSCSFGSKGSTYSTAASTTLPQQPLQTASSNASSQEAFEQQASDQVELLVEESTFKVRRSGNICGQISEPEPPCWHCSHAIMCVCARARVCVCARVCVHVRACACVYALCTHDCEIHAYDI